MKTKIDISCGFCRAKHEAEIDLPEGWQTSSDTIYECGAFCPEHAGAHAFLDAQCPGCVCSFPDCGLGKLREQEPTEFHINSVRAGHCPCRVNGTFAMSQSGQHDIHLEDRAPAGSGPAMLNALEDYRNWDAECRVKNAESNEAFLKGMRGDK